MRFHLNIHTKVNKWWPNVHLWDLGILYSKHEMNIHTEIVFWLLSWACCEQFIHACLKKMQNFLWTLSIYKTRQNKKSSFIPISVCKISDGSENYIWLNSFSWKLIRFHYNIVSDSVYKTSIRFYLNIHTKVNKWLPNVHFGDSGILYSQHEMKIHTIFVFWLLS